MYGQVEHSAICESDLQRLCSHLLEIEIARVSYRCQSRIANWQCQKTVGHAGLHFHNSFGSWPRRRRQIKPLVEKRKPQPTVRPEYYSQPDVPNSSKKLFGKVVPAKQRHAQSERMKDYWRRQAAGRTPKHKPHKSTPAVRNSKRFSALCARAIEWTTNYGYDEIWSGPKIARLKQRHDLRKRCRREQKNSFL
jgi:hypothetical protein